MWRRESCRASDEEWADNEGGECQESHHRLKPVLDCARDSSVECAPCVARGAALDAAEAEQQARLRARGEEGEEECSRSRSS